VHREWPFKTPHYWCNRFGSRQPHSTSAFAGRINSALPVWWRRHKFYYVCMLLLRISVQASGHRDQYIVYGFTTKILFSGPNRYFRTGILINAYRSFALSFSNCLKGTPFMRDICFSSFRIACCFFLCQLDAPARTIENPVQDVFTYSPNSLSVK